MILDKIVHQKRLEVKRLKSGRQFASLKDKALALPQTPGFFANSLSKEGIVSVIAEIKKKSPSKGILREDFDAAWIAKQYEKSGASALSVLTDRKFFAGSPAIFKQVREITTLPLLRKDFIIDEAQIYESKLLGTDAILLIARILTAAELKKFTGIAQALGLDILYEIHDEADWLKIKPLKPTIVGINNRDLDTFKVDLKTTQTLSLKIKHGGVLVAESGIATAEDLALVTSYGATAVLVGESLMRQNNPGMALRSLLKVR